MTAPCRDRPLQCIRVPARRPALRSAKHFDLRRHLPHLLRRAHFEAEALFASMSDDGATSRQMALLVAVHQMPGASQSQVAQAIGLDLNTCSDLVARTVAKGYLVRRRSETDRRTFCLDLTETGREVMAASVAVAPRYQARLAARLDKDEREQLTALLRKMLGFDE
ncbi:MarR family winged helix-turn-helix transcriptional regulator [Pigmentiphaga sp. NML080357]|uniref:MarR family winged helix-turn-helix transcriptional regulator n=1 Tax=Pigmentiphaga sp. NML080357 TaxID=2008675 RepID=UPI00118484D3|nr:MarR family winged helix-turn-helix transcriptional regulator [Pigmentiphaga sp. NML080357]